MTTVRCFFAGYTNGYAAPVSTGHSLSLLSVISADGMMNEMRPGKLVECSSNAVALPTIMLHRNLPYYCRLHPKMTGTGDVE